MKRKWFASLLALTVLVTMSLGACSKGGGSPTGPSATTETSSTPSENESSGQAEPSTPSETEESGTALTGLYISKLEASQNPVETSRIISITATVVNPSGTALSYNWSGGHGGHGGWASSSNVATWTAPNTPGEYRVQLYLQAENGEKTFKTIKIRVVSPPGMPIPRDDDPPTKL